ncbi:hypothetical protein [Pandoraea sputorum]|uniref:hypothetical protein n=1 Tax=Pandoraea sputorum TaxID=93222 RepID=UPI00123F8C69|nr:hypothetical protein [Pandoraea sputorum]VVE56186.1 Secreted effector protein SseC [Pandoraea sputorum]
MKSTSLESPALRALGAAPSRGAADAEGLPVGAGALHPRAPLGAHEPSAQRADGLHSPPPPREPVTLVGAEQALDRLLHAAFDDDARGLRLTRQQLEGLSPEGWITFLALMNTAQNGQLAQLEVKAMEIHANAMQMYRAEQAKELLKQGENGKAQAANAKSSTDWAFIANVALALITLVSGTLKTASGANHASGFCELFAGGFAVAKIVATCRAQAAGNAEEAKHWNQEAEKFSDLETKFLGFSMTVDVLSVGRVVAAGKLIADATKTQLGNATTLKNIVGDSLTASKQVTRDAIKLEAANVGRAVAGTVEADVTASIRASFGTMGRSLGEAQFTKLFNRMGIEQMVTRAVQGAVTRSVKSAATRGVVETESLVTEIARQVERQAWSAGARAALWNTPNTIKRVASAGIVGGRSIAEGVIELRQNKLQLELQKSLIDARFLQYLIDDFQQASKGALDGLKRATTRTTDMQASLMEQSALHGRMLQGIAGIAHSTA